MERRRLIAGNWKMNLTVSSAISLTESTVAAANDNPNVDVAIFPSFVFLHLVSKMVAGSRVAFGAQDVFWKGSGAYTGEVSPEMLADVGCAYCIVGHSERRGRFGVADDSPTGFFSDTNETVSRKASALIDAGITPIVCVGEAAGEQKNGQAEEVLSQQVRESLRGVECESLVIAYEPVWAIGTGEVCDPKEADKQCAFIRGLAGKQDLRVLYGGSVNANNAAQLFAMPSIDGGLVGGASLRADEFRQIINA